MEEEEEERIDISLHNEAKVDLYIHGHSFS